MFLYSSLKCFLTTYTSGAYLLAVPKYMAVAVSILSIICVNSFAIYYDYHELRFGDEEDRIPLLHTVLQLDGGFLLGQAHNPANVILTPHYHVRIVASLNKTAWCAWIINLSIQVQWVAPLANCICPFKINDLDDHWHCNFVTSLHLNHDIDGA